MPGRGFPRPSRKSALLLVLLSFTGVMMFNFFLFSGLRTVTAVRSAVFIAFTPAVVALASALFFRRELTC
ncbi:MAG: EamA family transporter [Spirochaetia bacterium]|nr:EamA family transporter [Spirochaetia bacterium]